MDRDETAEAVHELLNASPEVYALEVELSALEPVQQPRWWGSTLHGALGHALIHVGCGARCEPKESKHHGCPYDRLLQNIPPSGEESPLVGAMQVSALALRAPPPGEAIRMPPRSTLSFGLRLFGERALLDLGSLIAAIELMAERGLARGQGRLRLERVDDINGGEVWRNGAILAAPQPWPLEIPTEGRLRVKARTPLRVLKDGNIRPPSLGDLVGAAARRGLSLSARVGAGEPKVSIDALRESAEKVEVSRADWECFRVTRWSGRQRQRHPMRGHLGFIELEDPGELLPVLALAARLGVGKGTAFGFGAVDLEPASSAPADG